MQHSKGERGMGSVWSCCPEATATRGEHPHPIPRSQLHSSGSGEALRLLIPAQQPVFTARPCATSLQTKGGHAAATTQERKGERLERLQLPHSTMATSPAAASPTTAADREKLEPHR